MQPKKAIRIALFGLGLLSIGTQIYLMREFLIVFNGNELVIGVGLAMWMLLTGAGAYLGRFSSFPGNNIGFLIILLLITGILPSFMLAGLDLMKILLVPYGGMVSFGEVILAGSLVQLPFCLLNGFLFSWLCLLSSDNSLAGSYSWESLGSMVSGMLVNFVFLWMFDPFRSLLLLTTVYLILVAVLAFAMLRRIQFYLVLFFSLVLIGVLCFSDLRTYAEKVLYRDQKVIADKGTPYGQVVITENQKQLNFFENGLLLFSTGNEINREENVHFAMVQKDNPRHILLISGGFSGTLEEIMKYKPDLVDYVETDPSLIGITSGFTRQLKHSCIAVHETDARRFLRETKQTYDVVLVNIPPPYTLQLNRYYTFEFLKEIRKKMNPGAVIAYHLPTTSDYVSESAAKLNSVLWRTLSQCFTRVIIIPAEQNYFLASDSALYMDIPGRIQQKRIATVYVNRYYLDAGQMKERSHYVTKNLTLPGPVNHDFHPYAMLYQISWWLTFFSFNPIIFLLIFVTILLILLMSLNSVSAGLFTGGFTLASTEIILILGLQVLSGFVFGMIGAIIMIFMLGLATGSGFGIRIFRAGTFNSYLSMQMILAVYSICLPFLILWLNNSLLGERGIQLILAVSAFLAAFVVGMEYRMASVLSKNSLRETVTRNYPADLFGSAIGAFSLACFLFPFFGILITGLFLASLNLLSAFFLLISRRKFVSL